MVEMDVILPLVDLFLFLRHGNREWADHAFHNTVDATFIHLVMVLYAFDEF